MHVKWCRSAAFGAKGKAGVRLNKEADHITNFEAKVALYEGALEELSCRHVTEGPLWWQSTSRKALEDAAQLGTGFLHVKADGSAERVAPEDWLSDVAEQEGGA